MGSGGVRSLRSSGFRAFNSWYVTPAALAAIRKWIGRVRTASSYSTGGCGLSMNPYRLGSLAMRVAARNRGTYSRVSRLSSLVSVRSQKSSARARTSARPTFRSPALYAAIASGQEPKRWYRSRRYWAAASVDFTGSRRSSIQLSTRRPYVLAVGLINCHGPTALARETAFVLKPLSTSEREIRAAGRLKSAKDRVVLGR